jgi:uncharacterized protein (DUF1330 family)
MKKKEAPPPGFVVVDVSVNDPQSMARYRELATAAVSRYGGRYLVRGGASEVLEGEWWPDRLVIVQFESVDVARLFYHSPEYRAAREARAGAAVFDMLLIEGL